MKNKLEEIQYVMFVNTYYDNADIKTIINKIDKLELKTTSQNCDDKKWLKFIGRISGKLGILDALIISKKLEKNKNDVVEIGKYLQKLGKELEQFDENNFENEEPKKENEETIDNLIDKILEKFLGDDE